MRYVLAIFLFMFLAPQPTSAAGASLWDDLISLTIQHVTKNGPDSEAAEFIDVACQHAWARRTELVDLFVPYLKGDVPEEVAATLSVLYRFRGYRPISYMGDFEKANREFYDNLDQAVYAQISRILSLKDDRTYHSLALYLGVSRTADARRYLLEIAKSPAAGEAKEQALICLAWHRDANDMDALLPFMLEDSPAARSLPYHFRNSYGPAAIPYLTKALTDAASSTARLQAAFELVHLRVRAGYTYLLDLLGKAPDMRSVQSVRQFAIDYLGLPQSVKDKDAIAAHLKRLMEREPEDDAPQ